MTGNTQNEFGVTPGAPQGVFGGGVFDAFAAKIGPNPPPYIGPGCPCDCPGGITDLIRMALGVVPNNPPNTTRRPVRYFDGTVAIGATDLQSNGFGIPWGQTRSWTNAAGYEATAVNGIGWVGTQLPYLLQVSYEEGGRRKRLWSSSAMERLRDISIRMAQSTRPKALAKRR